MKRRDFIKLTSITGTITLINPLDIFPRQGQVFNPNLELEKLFLSPSNDAGVSVVWHWTGGIVTKEGITADLENMAASGINNVLWFSFQPGGMGGTSTTDIKPTQQLTPEWWNLVTHMINESKRLGINIAPHINSSWGPAGGPWITPELSQQTLAWSELNVEGGVPFEGIIPQPKRPQISSGRRSSEPTTPEEIAARKILDSYYRELGVVAFPVPPDWEETSVTRNAVLTTDLPITDLKKAMDPANNESVVNTEKKGYIQFSFEKPFTLRSVTVTHGPALTAGTSPYRPAHSMEVQAGNDGVTFKKIGNLEPMLNGWQTNVSSLTHTVTETTAQYFRLIHNPVHPIGYDESFRTGSRQSGGDFKNMVEPLSFANIILSSTPTVHHLPAKNASQWGRGRLVTDNEIPASSCVQLSDIIDLTDKLKEDGSIDNWTPPSGKWRIMRFGYVSENEQTGGGLQGDKFSVEATTKTFYNWFQLIRDHTNAPDIINILNVDSWEAGSQNWSPVMREEFNKRRGYDVLKYLPAMTGVMVGSASITESFLLDLRRTIADLITDNFYGTLYKLCHENNAKLASEVTMPTMCNDGMDYYRNTDWTGGEFWVRSNGCWKEYDIADAVSGARLYGKKITYAEAYTGGSWDEHPFSLKAMGDYHFTAGINRLILHVWNEQYIPDRVPGIPGAGTPFNHLNTWWKPASKTWIDYIRRCQALLQEGLPVIDAVYFIGENLPSRALVPKKMGTGFNTDPEMPEGYMSDSINRHALINLTSVKDGTICLESGMKYRMLILRPEDVVLSPGVISKIRDLVNDGAILVAPKPTGSSSLEQGEAGRQLISKISAEVWGNIDGKNITENKYGKGRVFWGMPMDRILSLLGIEPDFKVLSLTNSLTGEPVVVDMDEPGGTVAVLTGADRKGWGIKVYHKYGEGFDYYFVSNQEYYPVKTELSFRINGYLPEFWHADTGTIENVPVWKEENGRTIIPIDFDASASVFVLFRKPANNLDHVVAIEGSQNLKLQMVEGTLQAWASQSGQWSLSTGIGESLKINVKSVPDVIPVPGQWQVSFPLKDSIKEIQLTEGSWDKNSDNDIKYFSGTAVYKKEISLTKKQIAKNQRLFIDLGDVRNVAQVSLNNKDLGVLWKAPYIVDITEAAIAGVNRLEIKVTNTWTNRLIGDAGLPEEQRTTYMASGGSRRGSVSADSPTVPSGLLGPVQINTWVLSKVTGL